MTKKVLVVWTALIVSLVAGLCIIGTEYKRKNINDIMESSIVMVGKKYFGQYPGLFPAAGKSKKMTVKELRENGYKPELEDDCDGYIVVKNGAMGFDYKAFIKCPNYTTKGYESQK